MKSLLFSLAVVSVVPGIASATTNFSAQAASSHWSYVSELEDKFEGPQEGSPVTQYSLVQESGGFRLPTYGFGLGGAADRTSWSQYHQGLASEDNDFKLNGRTQNVETQVAAAPAVDKQPIRLQAGNLVSQVLSITPSKKPTRTVASTAPVAKTKYRGDDSHEVLTVQISSYVTQKEADAKVKQLKGKGLDAFTTSAKVNGSMRYRVCAGHYEHFEDAKFAKVQLSHRMHITDAFIHTATDDLSEEESTSKRMMTSEGN